MPLILPAPTLPPGPWEHLTAFTMLLADAAPTHTIYVGNVDVPDPPVPYWLVIPDPGLLDRDTLAGRSTRIDMRVQVKSVGSTTREALVAAAAARAVLVDVVPTVTGRRCWPIRHIDTLPVIPDPGVATTVVRRVQMATDTFLIASVPA